MSDWRQWLTQNAPWLDPLGNLATIVTLILTVVTALVIKPFRRAVLGFWSRLSRSVKKLSAGRRVTLHFIAIDWPHSHWTTIQGDVPVLVISTDWFVTHAPGSGSGIPVRLLKVLLLEPFAKHLVRVQPIVETENREGEIPEGKTGKLTIRCYLSTVLKSEKPIRVRLAVVDQLANKHKLPAVVVKHIS